MGKDEREPMTDIELQLPEQRYANLAHISAHKGQLTQVYERITIGRGDAIMIRPAIMGGMKRNTDRRHVAHLHPSVAPLLADIESLEIVSFEDKLLDNRYTQSREMGDRYNLGNYYRLSDPCACYEIDNAPYVLKGKEYIPSGRTIGKSRQEIFCETVGVGFDMANYDVRFTAQECDFADNFLKDKPNAMAIHLHAADKWRDYDFIEQFIDYAATHWDGSIITIDPKYRHKRFKNVHALIEKNIRNVWAVIARCRVLVGPDSFGVHAAGSTGIPVYGIYGPINPQCRLQYPRAAWNPRYELCAVQYCWYTRCKKRPCMNARTAGWYWEDIGRQLGEYVGDSMKGTRGRGDAGTRGWESYRDEVSRREEEDRERYKDDIKEGKDAIILNYVGQWESEGVTTSEGNLVNHDELWDLLTRYKYMCVLANIPDRNGKCLLHKGSEKLQRCLELGCDWGHAFPVFESCFDEVYGIEATERTARRGQAEGKNITWGVMESTPYRDDFFDLVISRHVLEHGTDPDVVINEIYRITKPEGWSIHTLPCRMDREIPGESLIHKSNLDQIQWEEKLGSKGFQIIKTFYSWNHDQEDWTVIARKRRHGHPISRMVKQWL